jgi:hypothetical protein
MALTDNILAYWNLNNNGSGGVSLVDSTGNGNTLTNNDGVTLGTGIIAGDAVFDPSLTNSLTTPITIGADYSISAWVNVTAFDGGVAAVGSSTDGEAPAIIADVSATYFFYGANDDGDCNPGTPSGPLSTGTWNHIVGTISSSTSTCRYYVNGTLISQDTYTNLGQFTELQLGAYFARSLFTFNGQLDEVGVWNRALTGAEVTELYNGGLGLSYPFGALYFSGGNLSSLSNWWQDDGFTIPAASLPSSSSIVFINQNATSGSLVCQSADINNASNAGSITGVCTFNGTSSNSGSIVGNCTFNNNSSNTGSITGNASVYYPAQNPLGGSVSGTISYFWPNGTGIWGGDVWIDGENVLIIPAENEVKAGVVYGFPAAPLTGTYSGGGGGGSSNVSIARLLNLPSFIKI